MITLRRELRLTFTDDPTGYDLSIQDLFGILEFCIDHYFDTKQNEEEDMSSVMEHVFQLIGHIEGVLQRPISESKRYAERRLQKDSQV